MPTKMRLCTPRRRIGVRSVRYYKTQRPIFTSALTLPSRPATGSRLKYHPSRELPNRPSSTMDVQSDFVFPSYPSRVHQIGRRFHAGRGSRNENNTSWLTFMISAARTDITGCAISRAWRINIRRRWPVDMTTARRARPTVSYPRS